MTTHDLSTHSGRVAALLEDHTAAIALARQLVAAGVDAPGLYPYAQPDFDLTALTQEHIAGSTLVLVKTQTGVAEEVLRVTCSCTGARIGEPPLWGLLRQRTPNTALARTISDWETAREMLAAIGTLVVYPTACQGVVYVTKADLAAARTSGFIRIEGPLEAALASYYVHVGRTGAHGLAVPRYQHPVDPDGHVEPLGPYGVPTDLDWLRALDYRSIRKHCKQTCGMSQPDLDALLERLGVVFTPNSASSPAEVTATRRGTKLEVLGFDSDLRPVHVTLLLASSITAGLAPYVAAGVLTGDPFRLAADLDSFDVFLDGVLVSGTNDTIEGMRLDGQAAWYFDGLASALGVEPRDDERLFFLGRMDAVGEIEWRDLDADPVVETG